MQSHKCAFLDGDICRADEPCQYQLFDKIRELETFCGKDQILKLEREK